MMMKVRDDHKQTISLARAPPLHFWLMLNNQRLKRHLMSIKGVFSLCKGIVCIFIKWRF